VVCVGEASPSTYTTPMVSCRGILFGSRMQPTWGRHQKAPRGTLGLVVRRGDWPIPGNTSPRPPQSRWLASGSSGRSPVVGLDCCRFGLICGPFPLVLALDGALLHFLMHFEHIFFVIPTCVLQNTYSLIYVEIR
jgi:hypothetical protein